MHYSKRYVTGSSPASSTAVKACGTNEFEYLTYVKYVMESNIAAVLAISC